MLGEFMYMYFRTFIEEFMFICNLLIQTIMRTIAKGYKMRIYAEILFRLSSSVLGLHLSFSSSENYILGYSVRIMKFLDKNPCNESCFDAFLLPIFELFQKICIEFYAFFNSQYIQFHISILVLPCLSFTHSIFHNIFACIVSAFTFCFIFAYMSSVKFPLGIYKVQFSMY